MTRDPTFVLLCAAMGAATVALSMLGTLVPLFAVDRAVGAVALGLLVALPNVFPVVLAVAAGRWVDAAGPTRWLFVGSVGMAVGPAALAVAPSVAVLAFVQLLIGVAQLFTVLAAQSLVADVANGRSRERNFSWFTTTLSAGRLVGPVLAGVAVDAGGFRAAFVAMALASLLPVALAGVVHRWARRSGASEARAEAVASTDAAAPPAPPAARPPAPAGRGDPYAPNLANVGVQLAVLASAGVFVAVSVRTAFLPAYLTDLGFAATAVGALISAGALAAVLVRPLMPWFVRRLGGPARTLVAAMASVAIGVGALGVAGSWAAFAGLAVVAGFGTGVGLPLSIVTVASHVDPRRRGAALGLRLSLNRAAQLAMPIAVGALLAATGYTVAFAVAGGALALLALVAAARVPTFERTPPVA